MFGFQRLDVYQCAIRTVVATTRLAGELPPGHSDLREQLRRAALSVPLNIAEGSGRGLDENRDAQRFYRIARGSALECAAILDVMEVLTVTKSSELATARELLERVVGMLTKLARAGHRD